MAGTAAVAVGLVAWHPAAREMAMTETAVAASRREIFRRAIVQSSLNMMRGIWVRVRVSFGAQSGHFAAESGGVGRGKGSCGTSTVLLGYSGCILFFGFYVNRLFYICYEDLQFYLFCTTRRYFYLTY